MRKFSYFLLVMALVITLIGCGKTGNEVDVTVAQETVTFHHIELHVIIPFELESMAALEEVVTSIASQTYERHFDEIGTETYALDIHLYDSQSAFDSETTTYGSVTYTINESITAPGLSFTSGTLVLN